MNTPFKGKSIAVSIIGFIISVIGIIQSFTDVFPWLTPQVLIWLGAISLVGSSVLSTFFPSGNLPTGWTVFMWASNIFLVIMDFLAYATDHALITASIANLIGALITAFINTWLKDYGNGSRINPPLQMAA